MKIVAIGGVPCSGKTTLAKRFIQRNMVGAKDFKFKKVRGSHKGGLIVVGIYEEGQVFAGTDRLSMAVQPEFLKWLEAINRSVPEARVFFEGDRLFTATVLEFIQGKGWALEALVLDVGEKIRDQRKALRGGDTQKPAFIQGRRTKYENILSSNLAKRVFHETHDDTQLILEAVEKFLNCV